jgi:hypothetical protein
MPRGIHFATHPPRFIKNGIHLAPRRREPPQPFTWPLGALDGIEPIVLASHGGVRLGVDLSYACALRDRELVVPVYAANGGEVACAIEGKAGSAISIDHSGTWTTHYTGLATMTVLGGLSKRRRRQSVRAGAIIGYANRPRIGFELWEWIDDRGFVAVDPRPHLTTWRDAITRRAA